MKQMKTLVIMLGLAMVLLGCSKLTRENFDKIEMGMEYDAVIGIIGEPDTCEGSALAKKCIWGDEKKNIVVAFMGEKVIMPSYKGL